MERTNVPYIRHLTDSPFVVSSWLECQQICQEMPECLGALLYPPGNACYLKGELHQYVIRNEDDLFTVFKYCRSGMRNSLHTGEHLDQSNSFLRFGGIH